MFAWWGRTVYRYRFIVIAVMVAMCIGGGLFGMSLDKHLTQSGFYDDNSESVRASVLADEIYGRDRTGHIVAVFNAPEGKTVDDPEWSKEMADELNAFVADHPDEVMTWVGYLRSIALTEGKTPEQVREALEAKADDPDEQPAVRAASRQVLGMRTADGKHTFVSIPLNGDDDDTILNNFKEIQPSLQKLDDGKVELAGLEPVADGLTGTIAKDEQRMEILALPMVAVVLFLVFGGVVAAFLPAIVGGLSIAGSMGILRFTAMFGPVHFFAQPAVTLVGLGIAVDYGLFVVSRFREEIAEGYDTEAAVRRTVITAGRTVTFSAVLIAASAVGLLVFPQGFLKSLTYAMIAAVMLSAILSITVLPAVLGILGPNVDALGVRTLFRIPFLANWNVSRTFLNWLADLLQKTKTRDEVEHEFWGKLANRVMKRPLLFALPIVVVMILLVIPIFHINLGGFSEKYLPPSNSVRLAQEDFDKLFPGYRTQPITLVIVGNDGKPVTDQQVENVRHQAMSIGGFIRPDNNSAEMWQERSHADGGSKDPSVRVIQEGLENTNDARKKVSELRTDINTPKGLSILVGGTPALEQDSIQGMFDRMPLMLLILLTTTTLLMFLAFGSVVLPLKAVVMSALTLGSTMGILTWIFVDGHFSGLLNFTPTPLTAPVIGLIIAIVFGLSTDYEVFLVSRMVEARESGMSTAEAVRIGTATTGRIITAAALVLAVVAGSFVFSDLVMMKYLAFGLMAALLLDATVIRMFLVPSIMKLLGDDCWWAPRWMKRVQNRIGLGETKLPDERRRPVTRRQAQPALAAASAGAAGGSRASSASGSAGTSGSAGAAGTKQSVKQPEHDPTRPVAGKQSTRPGSRTTPAQSRSTTRRINTGPKKPADPATNRLPGRSKSSTAGKPAAGKTPAEKTPAGKTPAGKTEKIQKKAPEGKAAGPAGGDSDREIENWLDDLRGAGRPPAGPDADRTADDKAGSGEPPADKTTAFRKVDPGKTDAGKPDAGKTTAIPKSEPPKNEPPKNEPPKSDPPKIAGKNDAGKTTAIPKADGPKGDEPKGDEPKGDEPKGDGPKNDAAKTTAIPKADAATTAIPSPDQPARGDKPVGTDGPGGGAPPADIGPSGTAGTGGAPGPGATRRQRLSNGSGVSAQDLLRREGRY